MNVRKEIRHLFDRRIGARILRNAALFVSFALGAGCSASESQPETRRTESASETPRVVGPAIPKAGVAASIPASSGFKPGELIVKYRSDGRHALVECAERWISEGLSFKSATADRSVSLDVLHENLGIVRARALMPGRTGLATSEAKRRLSLRTKPFALRAVRPPGAKVRSVSDLVNLYVLELPPQADVVAAARRLAADPHVEYAQPNYLVKADLVPNDPFFASSGSWGQAEDDLWGIKKIAAPTAWDVEQGDGVVVAVVDTGVDFAHPDLAANAWQNPDEVPGNGIDDDQNGFVDDVNGWNFDVGESDPTDDNGHGTHVSGTIAAVGENAIGVIGVAPRASIQALKALDAGGSGSMDKMALGIVYAAENGANVINNSWGCFLACPENPVVEDVVDLAYESGVTVVFAAGNSNADISLFSPQNRPNVIVVAASDPADARAAFSNHGFVDVAAPGSGFFTPPPDFAPFRNILSLKSSVCDPFGICPPEQIVGGDYVRLAGTSMAAPHVAGAAALVVGAHPSYSPEQVRQALRRGSADTVLPGVDTDSGYGRIDAAAAVAEPTPLEAVITGPLSPFGPLSGASATVTGTAAGPGFANYFLDVGFGEVPASFTTFAASTTPVVAGTLGTFSLAGVPDGINTLRVRATTSDGRVYEDRQRVVVDHVAITEPSYNPLVAASIRIYGSDPISVRGTVAPVGFVRYDLAVLTRDGVPVPGANITPSNGGTVPVVDGVLGVWNTVGVPAGGYQIVLTAQVTTGDPITRSTRLGVDRTLHPGWPVDFAPSPFFIMQAGNTDHMTAADVNGDGRAEVLVAFRSEVMVFGHTGLQLPGWPQSTGQTSSTARSPVVANVIGGAAVEVIGANEAGSVFVWSGSGALLFQAELGVGPCEQPTPCTPSLAVADVNRDGVNEIITADSTGTLTVFRAQSGVPPLLRRTFEKPVLSTPAIGDLGGDGQLEIAIAATDSATTPGRAMDLYVVGRNGVLTGWPRRIEEGLGVFESAQYPVIGDVDRNGKLDVVMTSTRGVVTAFAANGTTLPGWPQSATQAPVGNLATLGDLNGDGRLDTLVGTNSFGSSSLFALGSDGAILAGWPVTQGSPNIQHFGFGAAALADIDGDGGVEAVASTDSIGPDPALSLQAFHADGTLVAGFPKPTGYIGATGATTPAVADMDGDGLLELAWLDAGGKVYLWDLAARSTAKRPWPMFQHDAQHTGQADPLLRATFESRDGDPRNNLIQPKLRVVNGGGTPVPLGQVTMRYWYTNETAPSTQIFQLYFAQNETTWASIPSSQITSRFVRVSRPLADTYLEIGFTSSAGSLSPAGAVGLEFNVHAQNWRPYDERNDYSYSPSTTRIDWDHVTVYRSGVLVWGREP